MANWRSSSVSQIVVRGKFGRMTEVGSESQRISHKHSGAGNYAQNDELAIITVMIPSRMNTQRQARRPCRPFMLLVIPAVMSPPNAPETRDPE